MPAGLVEAQQFVSTDRYWFTDPISATCLVSRGCLRASGSEGAGRSLLGLRRLENNVSSTGTFNMPCVRQARAVPLGDAGSVPVSGGSFSDSFADGNAIHIYRIDGGTTSASPPKQPNRRPAPVVPAAPGDPSRRRPP